MLRILLLLFISIFSFPGLAVQDALHQKFVEGRILVHPRPGLSAEKYAHIIRRFGGHEIHNVHQIGLHVVDLPPTVDTVTVMKALNKNPNFDFVELDWAVEPSYVPNDPYYSSEWYIEDINADKAWDVSKGDGVIVAILDSGVDGAHPDLQSHMVQGWNFYDNNSNTDDIAGHGTAVAGIVGEVSDNNIGAASVGFNTKIMPLRITDPNSYGYFSLMAEAISYAADQGARVANISYLNVSLSDSVDLAAQYMRSKGGEVVIAAGNTGSLLSGPPRDSLIAVAATDSSDAVANFSSWGDYVDVAAPGIGVFTTQLGGGYGTLSGTSASSPVVAGIYALIIAANPDLSSPDMDGILFSTATDEGDSGYDQHYGYGLVNARDAVYLAAGTTPPPPDTEAPIIAITAPAGGEVSGEVTVTVQAADNVGVTNTELYVDDELYGSDAFAPYTYIWDTSQYTGTVKLTAVAYDAAGNFTMSDAVYVTIATNVDNTPPTVTIDSPADGTTVSGTTPITATASDNVSVSTMSLSIDGSVVGTWTNTDSISYSWTPKEPRGHGRYSDPYQVEISVVAGDPTGNVGMTSATVFVTSSGTGRQGKKK